MLLIIQNGYLVPCLPKYLNEEYIIIKSFEVDVSQISLANYAVIIILGGHQSVTMIDHYPYLQNVVNLIKQCIRIKKPLFAICLGAQLVAYALGCEIKSSSTLNIGYDVDIIGYHNLFRCHVDYVVPSDNIVVDQYLDNIPYLYHYDNHVIGIQCHPDLTPECVVKYSNHPQSIEYALKHNQVINKTNKLVINRILKMLKKLNI